ncbi:pyruvate transporter mpc1 [Hanseniaspora opuntiae]|jgi:mitochondrial pyruvate carrier 1|uniref:Mitochondrial pyruvate carrier n=1 Tax=Hanseniaspora opuntiae TaxID=211096 RepID=A0A1E5RKR2_9ASCO|nr:Mitochondrial pyruvate carrier 1 [Hanseniaspora opuntiae]
MSNKVQQVATKSLMAKYLNKDTLKYMLTTHFWGPVSNFGIPIAALYDLNKDEALISGSMTSALVVYSAVFMRYALAVTPKNYLLFGCHVINTAAQTGQGIRYIKYHYFGGKEKAEAAEEK